MAERPWWQRKLPRPLRWYRIPRSYRVVDEVYVLATSAREATSQHWEGFMGTGYSFGDDALAWSTQPDDVGDIRMSRVRRAPVEDVPAWMVNAAVKLKAQPADDQLKAALERWNMPSQFGIPRYAEDARLALYLPGGRE